MTAKKIKLIALVCLAVLAIIWIFQNDGSVQTKFLFITVTLSQAALLAITLLLGVAVGAMIALNWTGKRNKKNP